MAIEKIDAKIKKKEKQVKQILELEGKDFKEWYLNSLNSYVEENLDKVFELIGR